MLGGIFRNDSVRDRHIIVIIPAIDIILQRLKTSRISNINILNPTRPTIETLIEKGNSCYTLKFNFRFYEGLSVFSRDHQTHLDLYLTTSCSLMLIFHDRVMHCKDDSSGTATFIVTCVCNARNVIDVRRCLWCETYLTANQRP